MSKWPLIPLGEILHRVERFEPRDDFVEYPFAGTYSFARGIFVGERKMGSSFSLPKVQRLKEGDFVYCKIMAWEGAFGLVPKAADNCVMSGAFVVYELDRNRIEPRFLEFFFKVSAHWQAIGIQSTGTNVRRQSLHPTQFEKSLFPLPPLPEQRRIVARIEGLAAKINEARGLRQQAVQEAESFVTSLHVTLAGTRIKKLADILRLDEHPATVISTGSYPQVGVKSFGAGLFPKTAVIGSETTYKTFNRLYQGALVLSQVKGWEGAVAICPADLDGWFVSPEYRTFRCVESEVLPGYLATLVRTRWFWEKLGIATRGVGARRERTRPEQFINVKISIPTVEKQAKAERIFAQLENVLKLQAATVVEVDALVPSLLRRAFQMS